MNELALSRNDTNKIIFDLQFLLRDFPIRRRTLAKAKVARSGVRSQESGVREKTEPVLGSLTADR
jgi:hypothetical protein